MILPSIRNGVRLALALASIAAVGQAQAPANSVRLQRAGVVAVDAQGQPVSNLTADDFRVSTDGKSQKIVLFHAPVASPALRPGEVSNRPAATTHTTAVLFDLMEQDRTDRLDASRRIGQSLKGLEGGESVFVYALLLDGTLAPLHAFPENPSAKADGAWAKDIDSALAKLMKGQNGARPVGLSQEDVVKRTYVALENLANHLAFFPGRHDIVWVTNDIPTVLGPKTCSGDWIDCALYVPHLAVTLERAGARVHPISYASGLKTEPARMMDEMAGLTGGRARFNEDLRAVIQDLGQAGLGAYSLAWDPPADSWDSKFHKLKITCERKGVKLDTRQRFYALPDTRPPAQREQGNEVAAYQSVNDVAEIGLRASAPAKGNSAHVEIRIDPADLLLHEKGGAFDGELVVLFSARTAAAPQGDPAIVPWPVHLTREQHDAAMKDGVVFTRDFPIDAATTKARIIVLDRATAAVGSVDVPVR